MQLISAENDVICEESKCTGCGACAYICPKKCVEMKKNEYGELYPKIDIRECIRCQKCKGICPQNRGIALHLSRKAYVGWSRDSKYREESASGGIASSIYQYYLDRGRQFVGTYLNDLFLTEFKIGSTSKDIETFGGSKYVFSELYKLYDKIDENQDKNIVFIGLPCQVAAMKNIYGEKNIIYVDLICHGVCSSAYLKEHILSIAKLKPVNKVIFRDPEYGTANFIFSIFSRGKRIYKRGVDWNDVYQLAYHKSLDYRENCYECIYAQPKRSSDITIGDYWGLGKKYPYEGEKKNISLVLANTKRGELLLEDLVQKEYVNLIERPLDEALSTERQLMHPSTRPRERTDFLAKMKSNGYSFEKTLKEIYKIRIIFNYLFPVSIRRIIRRIIK